MKRTLREEANELGISVSYLSDILHGNKGCNEELMLCVKLLHPELDFTLMNPRYKLRKESDKPNYMEQRINKAIEELEEEIEQSDGCIYVELPEELYIKKLQKYLDILRGEDNANRNI